MSAGERWTLVQALAWVLTRDHDLVAEIANPAADGAGRTPLWLIVTCIRGREGLSLTRDGWLPLSERITDGRVRADGRPALPGHALSDRQPLSTAARDLRVSSDRDTPGAECFLAGDSENQQGWYAVEFMARDVERSFPSPGQHKNRGGAPERYDWVAIEAHVMELIRRYGLPGRTNRKFKTQADIERAALEFSSVLPGGEPSENTMRARVRIWLREYRPSATT